MTVKELKKLSRAELEGLMADAKKALESTPDNAEAKELVENINKLLSEGGSGEEKKSKLVKVRNTGTQPIQLDGIVIGCAVTDKKGKVVKEAPVVEIPASELPRLGKMVAKVALFLALLVSGFTASAQGQYVGNVALAGVSNVFASGTYTLPVTTTNGVIAAQKFEKIGLFITQESTGANGTNTTIYRFVKGRDQTDTNGWETTPSILITNTANGTTAVRSYTEVDMGACGALKLHSIINNSTNAVTQTNTYIYPTKKPGV